MVTQPVVEVYVDTVYLLNFVTDLAWLWATSTLAGLPVRWTRMLSAAAVGAACAVWSYFPTGQWLLSGPGVVGGTALLLALAFWPLNARHWLKGAAYLLFCGAAMAGVVMLIGLRGTGGSQGSQGQVPGQLVVAGILLCLAGIRHLWEAAEERFRLAKGMLHLRVQVGERSVEVPALLDTGNGLRDPIGGEAVAVVEATALAACLPTAALETLEDGWEALDGLPGAWSSRCRLIPYRSVGRPQGVMLAFAPDGLWLKKPSTADWVPVRGLIGLAGQPLHPDGAYAALVPPQMVVLGDGPSVIVQEEETG